VSSAPRSSNLVGHHDCVVSSALPLCISCLKSCNSRQYLTKEDRKRTFSR
jgi:hypothetical protein